MQNIYEQVRLLEGFTQLSEEFMRGIEINYAHTSSGYVAYSYEEEPYFIIIDEDFEELEGKVIRLIDYYINTYNIGDTIH